MEYMLICRGKLLGVTPLVVIAESLIALAVNFGVLH